MEKPITKKRFMELFRELYTRRAKAENWRPSELAMTLANLEQQLASTWRKTRKAQLTEQKVIELMRGKET